MRCDVAERELSARLDGDVAGGSGALLDAHLETCSRCRTFLDRAERIRETVRLEPVGPMPDLVPRIMERVGIERLRRVTPEWHRLAASFAAAALAAAVVAGSLPGLRQGSPSAVAADLPRLVAEAAADVEGYVGTFSITERNFHPQVPERRFDLKVAFHAP